MNARTKTFIRSHPRNMNDQRPLTHHAVRTFLQRRLSDFMPAPLTNSVVMASRLDFKLQGGQYCVQLFFKTAFANVVWCVVNGSCDLFHRYQHSKSPKHLKSCAFLLDVIVINAGIRSCVCHQNIQFNFLTNHYNSSGIFPYRSDLASKKINNKKIGAQRVDVFLQCLRFGGD